MSISNPKSSTFRLSFETVEERDKAIKLINSGETQNKEKVLVAFETENPKVLKVSTSSVKRVINNSLRVNFENGKSINNFDKYLIFKSITNGTHSETGYLIDTSLNKEDLPKEPLPLTGVNELIVDHFAK